MQLQKVFGIRFVALSACVGMATAQDGLQQERQQSQQNQHDQNQQNQARPFSSSSAPGRPRRRTNSWTQCGGRPRSFIGS